MVYKDDEEVVKSLRTSSDLLSKGSFNVQFVVGLGRKERGNAKLSLL